MASMKQRLIFEGVVLLLACGGLFAGLASWDLTPKQLTEDVTRELETKLGDAMVHHLRRGSGSVHTDSLDKALDQILTRLVRAQGSTRFPYSVEVLDAPQINAVMLPGGRIIVFRGLLDVMEAPEELAAVLAHEMAHAEKRHISKRLARQFGLTVLFGAAGGDSVVLREITEQLIASAFDRAQEHEADRSGRDLMAKARLDPRAMATAFRHMKQGVEQLPRALQVLSTHPDIDERIRDALAHPVSPGGFSTLGIDWNAVKKSLPPRRAPDPE